LANYKNLSIWNLKDFSFKAISGKVGVYIIIRKHRKDILFMSCFDNQYEKVKLEEM